MSTEEKPTKTLFEKPSESQCPPEAKAIFEDLAIDDGEIEDFFEDNSIDVDEIKSSSNEEIVKESSKEEDGVEEPAKECEEEENTSKDGDEPKAPTNDEHADDLKELIARWKNAIEKENGEELENVYDDIVRLADTFSFDFIKGNSLDTLIKRSIGIKKSRKSTEAKKAVVEAYKLKKAAKKEATAAAREAAAESKANAKAKAVEGKKSKKRKSEAVGPDGKPEKTPRIKSEKVQEVAEKMTAELAKNYEMGIKELSLDVLTTQVGYKSKRSDAIFEAVKLLKKNGIADKLEGGICKLTEKGVKEHVKEVEEHDNPDALLDMYKKQFLIKLGSLKNGSGNKVQTAASQLWDLLRDGRSHQMQAVLEHTGYGMERSTGIAEILKVLTRELEFAVKENKTLKFTDKVYGSFGRP